MDEKIKQLAETLRKSGLAVSDADALEKAKAALQAESIIKQRSNLGIDISKPIGELMKENKEPTDTIYNKDSVKRDGLEEKSTPILSDEDEAASIPLLEKEGNPLASKTTVQNEDTSGICHPRKRVVFDDSEEKREEE